MKNTWLTFFLTAIYSFPLSSQSVQKFTAYFNYNTYSINSPAQNCLDSAVAFVANSKIKPQRIEILAYCDSVGSYQYNDSLSRKRAKAVYTYLSLRNINTKLITTNSAWGKRRPINNNSDDTQRALNRRVEVLVYYNAAPAPTIISIPAQPLTKEKTAVVDTTPPVKTLDLTNVPINGTMVLANIIFYPNSHEPLPSSYPYLKILLNTLRQNKNLTIDIQGHVCCTGILGEDQMDQDTYTPDLSVQRARGIYQYLVKGGIDSTRLSYHGFAGKHHLVKEVTEEDKQKNRRVEIKILSK